MKVFDPAPGAGLRALLLLPLAAAVNALQRLYDPGLSAGHYAAYVFLRCPLKWLTDIDCPTCGLGRSLVAAFLGDWSASFRYHPLGLPLILTALLAGLLWVLNPFALREALGGIGQWARQHRSAVCILACVYVIWGFTRPWHFPIPT